MKCSYYVVEKPKMDVPEVIIASIKNEEELNQGNHHGALYT